MPFNVNCPQCGILLQMPDGAAGKTVKCSSCQKIFAAGPLAAPVLAEAQPPPPQTNYPASPPPFASPAHDRDEHDRDEVDEADWRPSRRRPRGDDDGEPEEDTHALHLAGGETDAWQSVVSGLRLHVLAQYLYALGLGIFLVFFLLMLASNAGRGGGTFLQILLTLFIALGALLIFLNQVLALVAACFFLAAPPRHGAKAMAMTCLVMGALTLFSVIEIVPRTVLVSARPFPGSDGAAVLMALGGFTILELCRLSLFPLFVRAVAVNMKNPSLGWHGISLTIATPTLFVALFLITLLVQLVRRPDFGPGPGVATTVLTFVNVLAFVGLLIWGATVLQSTARLVKRRIRTAL